MKLKFKWVRKTGQFQTGENLYRNGMVVAGYSWNMERRRDSQVDTWKGFIDLPSLSKNRSVVANTEEDIKSKIEAIITK